jgi:hypothetical protein
MRLEYYCRDMADCGEAVSYYTECDLSRLDGDGDGIPCETLCGKSQETFQLRRDAARGPGLVAPVLQCGNKQRCDEMVSCEEARFYLAQCGRRRLDADGDGVPCKGLCR